MSTSTTSRCSALGLTESLLPVVADLRRSGPPAGGELARPRGTGDCHRRSGNESACDRDFANGSALPHCGPSRNPKSSAGRGAQVAAGPDDWRNTEGRQRSFRVHRETKPRRKNRWNPRCLPAYTISATTRPTRRTTRAATIPRVAHRQPEAALGLPRVPWPRPSPWASSTGWHALADLVERGCSPRLALDLHRPLMPGLSRFTPPRPLRRSRRCRPR